MTTDTELTIEQFEDLVVELYTDPATKPTVGTIANRLGVNYGVVYRALKRRRVRMRPQGPPRGGFLSGSKSEEIAKMLVTNSAFTPRTSRLSYRDIAHKVGCSRELVRVVRSRLKDMGKVK